MGPRLASVDDTLIDRVKDFEHPHDGSGRKHFHVKPTAGHFVDAVGHPFDELEINTRARYRGLDLEFVAISGLDIVARQHKD
jgi:hypothetical protein